jgi:hypothetical protein
MHTSTNTERIARPTHDRRIRVGERRPDLAARRGKPVQHRRGVEVVR